MQDFGQFIRQVEGLTPACLFLFGSTEPGSIRLAITISVVSYLNIRKRIAHGWGDTLSVTKGNEGGLDGFFQSAELLPISNSRMSETERLVRK